MAVHEVDTRFLIFHNYISCRRKYAFDTWDAAERHVECIKRQRNYAPRGFGLFAYRCLYDPTHYHVGHDTKRARYRLNHARRELEGVVAI